MIPATLVGVLVGAAVLSAGVGFVMSAMPKETGAGLAMRLMRLRGELAEAPVARRRRVSGLELFRDATQRAAPLVRGRVELFVSPEMAEKLVWSGVGLSGEAFAAVRLLSTGAGAVLGGLLLGGLFRSLAAVFPMALVGAGLGWVLPDSWLNSRLQARRRQIRKELPAFVDLMATAARAGLSLEESVVRVERETGLSIARLFGQALRSLEVGANFTDAMDWVSRQLGMKEVDDLVQTVTRAREYGTPYSQVLSDLGSSLRLELRSKAQERAGKMGTLMSIPLVVFILPVTLILVGYPAFSSLMNGVFGSQ